MAQVRRRKISQEQVPAPAAVIDPSADSFTPKRVQDLLREVLKNKTKLPNLDSPGLIDLAWVLNILHWKVKGWRGPWPRELEKRDAIADAIYCLTEDFPDQRKHYLAEVEMCERWETDESLSESKRLYFAKAREDAQARLIALDDLTAAAERARELGLPMIFSPELVMSSPTKRWVDIAKDLRWALEMAVPDCSKESVYRFIEAVVPDITGEQPSHEAVKTAFKKKRLENRGNATS